MKPPPCEGKMPVNPDFKDLFSELCAATPGTIFQIGIEPNRVDVVTHVDGLEFASAWEQCVPSTYGGISISILGMDDLLLNKRTVGRPQDLLDVEKLEGARERTKPS